ncbi:MAG: surface lipoprotein assembly modifier [Casimicrobiaceae bacterium]
MQRRSSIGKIALLACACFGSPAAFAATIDEVHANVEASRSVEAWAQCATIDRDTLPAADLWCGIAAIDTGHTGEGVLSLERYSLLNPDDARGRLELARAYFYAGDDRRAREEFQTVQSVDPPPEVRAGIQRYLDALKARESQYLASLTGYIEAGVGYDSNINAGVAQSDIALPVLGLVSVADAGIRKGAGFGVLAGAVQYNHPVAPGASLFIGGIGTGNFYFNNSEFNLAQAAFNAGGSYRHGIDTLALTYAYGQILLDGDNYRSSNGAALEWRRQLGPTTTISLTPQYARLDYSGDNDVRDADFYALGLGIRHGWLSAWQPVLNASVYGGEEHDIRDRPDLGRNLAGASADVTVSPSPFWALNAGVAYLRSRYEGDIALIDVTRRDNNYVASLGALYLFARNWSTRLEYQYQRNESNIELYEYTRNLVMLKLRYEFK